MKQIDINNEWSAGTLASSVAKMLSSEREKWIADRPKTLSILDLAKKSELHGTPTYRVNNFPPPVPLMAKRMEAARIWDADDHLYRDFALSGSAALFGHARADVLESIKEQLANGLICDWPSEEHASATELMAQHFGLPIWQFTLSASDANRFALRLARVATGRQKVLVFNGTYHGSQDETHAVLTPDGIALPKGISRNGFDIRETTKVVEFNDIEGTRAALRDRDVAAVLVEPAITTCGSIAMPDPGFHDAVKRLCDEAGTLLIVDETQTICAGPGGFTKVFGLQPDIITMGKWIAGGLPVGMYGMTRSVAKAVEHYGYGAIGSTLAAGALSTHVMQVMLRDVITEKNFAIMIGLAERYHNQIEAILTKYDLPWHVIRLGARVAFAFDAKPPRTGTSSLTQEESRHRSQLHEAIWLYLANRGVLMHGWDCTSLFSPVTQDEDIELHAQLIDEVLGILLGRASV